VYGTSSGMYSSTSIRSLYALRFGRCILPMTLCRNSAPDDALVWPVTSPTAVESSGNSCTTVNTHKTVVRTVLQNLVTRKIYKWNIVMWLSRGRYAHSRVQSFSASCPAKVELGPTMEIFVYRISWLVNDTVVTKVNQNTIICTRSYTPDFKFKLYTWFYNIQRLTVATFRESTNLTTYLHTKYIQGEMYVNR